MGNILTNKKATIGQLYKFYSLYSSKLNTNHFQVACHRLSRKFFADLSQKVDKVSSEDEFFSNRIQIPEDGEVVFFINGNAEIKKSFNSHLRCITSYAIQFKSLGRASHLIYLNIPSRGNYHNWESVGRKEYKDYVEETVVSLCGFNPYKSVSIIFDKEDKGLHLGTTMRSLKKFVENHMKQAALIFGCSGGGFGLLGSHGLEWAEALHQGLTRPKKATLMCHPADYLEFTCKNILLSMSLEATKACHDMAEIIDYYNSQKIDNQYNFKQARMIDPLLFNNPRAKILSAEEIEVSKQIQKDDKLLLIAGPALFTKWRNSIYVKRHGTYSFDSAIKSLLKSHADLKILLIGGDKEEFLNKFPFADKEMVLSINKSNNFTELLLEIKNKCNHIIATFPPQQGNGSTNSQIALMDIPAIFLGPNDAESMCPKQAFVQTNNELHRTLQSLLKSKTYYDRYKQNFAKHKKHNNLKSLVHAEYLLNPN